MAYLIKGAHVVDPQVGLDDVRDVLIEDKTIVSVEPSIAAADATVTPASSTRRPSPPARALQRMAASRTSPRCPIPSL